MKSIFLKRVTFTKDGTFGVLMDDEPFALTCEREWLDNKSDVSCIPAGIYLCKRVNSLRFGDTFEVTDVPGRTHILFHSGNTEDDSKGCILVGEEFGAVNGKIAVLSSRRGFAEFLERLKDINEFTLLVKEYA